MKYFALIILSLFTLSANAERRLVWNDQPVKMALKTGHETRVIFPKEVEIQVPLGIAQELQALAPNHTTIYWKANSDFSSSRILAHALDGSDIYIIDLTASANAPIDDVVIEDPSLISLEPDEVAINRQDARSQSLSDPVPVILTRFASQSLYAPERLMPTDSNISPVDVVDIDPEFPIYRSHKGESFQVKVAGAWYGYGQYVTAILLINQAPVGAQINGHRVIGAFSNITAQHLYVSEANTLEDRTVIYVVSKVPFESAILEDGYAF